MSKRRSDQESSTKKLKLEKIESIDQAFLEKEKYGLIDLDLNEARTCITKIKELCKTIMNENEKLEKNLLSDYEKVMKKHRSLENRKIKIAFFSESGGGKSSLINFLISGQINNNPLPTSASTTRCSKVPILCKSIENNKYTIKLYKKDSIIPQNVENLDQNEVIKKINEYNEECSNFQLIEIDYPITNVKLTPNIDLIDLIGVPDRHPETKQDFCINNKDALERILQIEFDDLNKEEIDNCENCVDAIFVLKSLGQSRFNLTIQDVRNMHKSGLFQGCNKYQAPALVIFKKFDSLSDLEKNKIESQKDQMSSSESIILALCEAFNYPLPASHPYRDSDPYKQTNEILELYKDDDFYSELLDRDSLRLLTERASSSNYIKTENMSQESVKDFEENFEEITKYIKKYREKSNVLEMLYDMAILEAEFKLRIKPKLRKRKISNQNIEKILNQINIDEYLPKATEIIERFTMELNQQTSIKKLQKIELKEKLKSWIKSDWKPFFTDFLGKIENVLKNENLKKNEKSLEKLDEFNDIFFEAIFCGKENLENFSEQLTKNKELFKKTIFAKAKELLTKVKNGLFSEDDNNNDTIKKLSESLCKLNDTGCQKFINENLTYRTRESFKEKLPMPIRFRNKIYTINHLKIPTKSDQSKIKKLVFENQIETALEFINTEKIKSNQPKKLKSENENMKKISAKSSAQIEYTEITGEFANENVTERYERKIQIHVDMDKKILAEYDKKKLMKSLDSVQSNLQKYESEEEKNLKFALAPVFIWIKKLDKIKMEKKNIHLKSLCSTIPASNFLIFLFVTVGQCLDRDMPQLEILNNIIENEKNDVISRTEENNKILAENKKFLKNQLPIVPVFLPSKFEGKRAHILKLMFLLAQHLKLRKFYDIDDQIDILEFNSHRLNWHSQSFGRGLVFMSKLLYAGINGQDEFPRENKTQHAYNKLENDLRKPVRNLSSLVDKLQNNENINNIDNQDIKLKLDAIENYLTDLKKAEDTEKINSSRYSLLGLIRQLDFEDLNNRFLDSKEDCATILSEIRNFLLGPFSTTLGYIALENNKKTNKEYLNRLISRRIPTHGVLKPQYKCVLYNLDCCLENIHPISDEDFFSFESYKSILNDIEDDFVYIQLLNGISGFVMYYFSYCVYDQNKTVDD